MSKFLFEIKGVRGRSIKVYDNKCEIATTVTVGSLLTHNATDGEKTIFYIDVTGIQFKKSGLAIGYLQMETPSMQMNNQGSNFFSENTFTFDNANTEMNDLMTEVYKFVAGRVEAYKYRTGAESGCTVPDSLLSRLARIQPQQTPAAQPQPTVPQSQQWNCGACGAVNNGTGNFCVRCGTRRA